MNAQSEAAQAPVLTKFSGAELAALMTIAGTPASLETAERLRVLGADSDGLTKQYGLSGLVARGLAVIEGDEVSTSKEASTLARVTSVADQWLEIGFVAEGVAEGAVIVGGPGGDLMFGAAAAGTYDVVALKAGVPAGNNIAELVFGFLDGAVPSAVGLNFTFNGQTRRVAVKHESASVWRLAQGQAEPGDMLPESEASRDAAFAAVVDGWTVAID